MAPTTPTKKPNNRVDIRAFIKDSRAKMKQQQQEDDEGNNSGSDSASGIVLFESSSGAPRSRSVSVPLEPYFTLVCRDGAVFSLPMSIAKELGCVRTMLATETFRETEKKELHLQELDGDMVEKILQFCFEDSIFNPVSSSSDTTKKSKLSKSGLFTL